MKRKIICLVSVLLILCTLLTSCGSVASLGKVLNKKYDLSPDLYKKATDLADLKGYTFDDSQTSEEFALFYKAEKNNATYKVLSLRSGAIVGTFNSNNKTFYDIEFIEDMPAFFVRNAVVDTAAIDALKDNNKKAQLNDIVAQIISGTLDINEILSDALNGYVETTYTLHDAAGAVVASSKWSDSASVYADVIIFDSAAYSIDENAGTLEKSADIPEYMEIGSCDFYNDDYFYIVDENKLTVYDRSFKHKFTYVAPHYGDDSVEDEIYNYNILNNGNILLQYTVTEDEDAKRYDMSYVEGDKTYKSSLVSKLISVKNGKARDVKLEYIVAQILTNTELYDEDKAEEKNAYNDKFENIAIICPIVNRKLMVSEADIDIVLMNNKAQAKKSLKIIEGQTADVATKIGDDQYMVKLLDGGSVIIKANGMVLSAMNKSLSRCGSYFIGNKAIYNLDLSVAFDLKEKDAEVLSRMNRAILIKAKTDVGYDIIKLLNGKEETIYSHNDSESKTEFYTESRNCYVIKDSSDQYSYYNEEGHNIVISKGKLESVTTSAKHTSQIFMVKSEEETNYCLFTK